VDATARARHDERIQATEVVIDLSDATTPADLRSARTPSTYELRVKPILDRVGGVFLVVLTSPLLALAALAILLTMGGPVILRQERVGRHGEVFVLYKFRTMDHDRRNRAVPFVGEDRRKTHKHPEDPRITRVGKFLRVWSLDELPQFFNVVKGDMSLVGPRPEMVQIVAHYEPWQHHRHAVKPGITGLWQISERGDKMLHECTESDLEYLDRVSAWTDAKILMATPLAALGMRRGS
jgi:lipopolysaccharide/colanic/teichoic acid biosynthesis glycosyltransferase